MKVNSEITSYVIVFPCVPAYVKSHTGCAKCYSIITMNELLATFLASWPDCGLTVTRRGVRGWNANSPWFAGHTQHAHLNEERETLARYIHR